ncbi:hypothetical protein D9757_009019 [Collybiopsis confluens]|uniref:Helitron helicase-like domain-containing protein n=1 Tax=Collybiopsis confluens TaxID=2823264 RepID=A0A8H5HDC1_9AGAR|nr:hypothetical protein D9757_009019 [Collybiopsis confluens]
MSTKFIVLNMLQQNAVSDTLIVHNRKFFHTACCAYHTVITIMLCILLPGAILYMHAHASDLCIYYLTKFVFVAPSCWNYVIYRLVAVFLHILWIATVLRAMLKLALHIYRPGYACNAGHCAAVLDVTANCSCIASSMKSGWVTGVCSCNPFEALGVFVQPYAPLDACGSIPFCGARKSCVFVCFPTPLEDTISSCEFKLHSSPDAHSPTINYVATSMLCNQTISYVGGGRISATHMHNKSSFRFVNLSTSNPAVLQSTPMFKVSPQLPVANDARIQCDAFKRTPSFRVLSQTDPSPDYMPQKCIASFSVAQQPCQTNSLSIDPPPFFGVTPSRNFLMGKQSPDNKTSKLKEPHEKNSLSSNPPLFSVETLSPPQYDATMQPLSAPHFSDNKNSALTPDSVAASSTNEPTVDEEFPPPPTSQSQINNAIRHWCKASSPENFEETGCSVCGQLSLKKYLSPLKHIANMLRVLDVTGVTRAPRFSSADPIKELPGPVLDDTCNDMVCDNCRAKIRKGTVPKLALCNGLWLGNIPPELKDLTFYEGLLVARVRHSKCFVRVRKGGDGGNGHCKLVSNVIAFENPTPKIYNILPPPREDIEEVLAVMFSGSAAPTDNDYKRALLFVRRNVVARAIKWCIINHSGYDDVTFSPNNLEGYGDSTPVVSVEYFRKSSTRTAEGISVHDDLEEDGLDEGECAFTVQGIVGEDIEQLTTAQLKARAIKHLDDEGKFLRTSHAAKPESIWSNPALYPKMFPWLFPYGYGGIGSTQLSDEAHKKFLLLYHDKRFQLDLAFPFVAFSHEQIKAGTTKAFLLADRKNFEDISTRLLSVNTDTLQDLATRIANHEFVNPQTDSEIQCFALLRDLDQGSSRVKGSITSKKNMLHEIWSLVTHVGGPVWYFTLAPCDFKHPICIYYADTREEFNIPFQGRSECRRLLSRNPVAGARFFDFMVRLFLEHVIGDDSSNTGVLGPVSAYYCTVEQQGRLTLHLHGMAFPKKKLSPLEIKERLMDPTSDFQTRLLAYIDSIRVGQFLTGSKDEVQAAVKAAEQSDSYMSPELRLPVPPPPECGCESPECAKCATYIDWLKNYFFEVDCQRRIAITKTTRCHTIQPSE